jgi:hypothetical protein
MITKERLKEMFDYRDGELIRKKTTSRLGKAGQVAGTKCESTGYVHVGISGKHYLVHRLIFLYHHGNLPEFIDHINGNSMDNRIENLRQASKHENCRNRTLHKNNRSGCKNVAWMKANKTWSVSLYVGGKKKHVGYFKDLEFADLVATEARNLYHGAFARHH